MAAGRIARQSAQATSLACAALGGMIMPAVIFPLIAKNEAIQDAWAIPVATDADR
jgi:Na+/H+ antiporter NhaA